MALISAYYFRSHMYTLVPRHVREDLAWMAAAGTNAICLAVLEQDLFAAEANLDILHREAEHAGLKVWAVPSRWAGMVAGAPKAPSLFASTRPDTWSLRDDGTPHAAFGPVCSVHHPEVQAFFTETIEELVKRWPFHGIIWDEPKPLGKVDHSPMAQAAAPEAASVDWHTRAFTDFLDGVSATAKAARPGLQVALFTYAFTHGAVLQYLAAMRHLDEIGCSGRPWSQVHDSPSDHREEAGKSLLDEGPRFIDLARKHGKRALLLVENHNMQPACFDLMDRRLPEVLRLGADHLLYYYYPRNVCEPDRQMDILARHLTTHRAATD